MTAKICDSDLYDWHNVRRAIWLSTAFPGFLSLNGLPYLTKIDQITARLKFLFTLWRIELENNLPEGNEPTIPPSTIH